MSIISMVYVDSRSCEKKCEILYRATLIAVEIYSSMYCYTPNIDLHECHLLV